ncbi:DUF4142 domain-containing protein [Sphingomonas sp. IW22]|uniref:DUF4142 domain-containing protein n=1 Tax=Sphingomonas sp. IW22 TaxID=3242489 RepID=UPI003521138F
MRHIIALALPAAVLLLGCADDPIGNATPDQAARMDPDAPASAMPTTASAYLAAAASSDQYEIQSSQMVEGSDAPAPVRDFARMMIQHHQKTTQTLTGAARSAGITPPPPSLQPKHAQMLAQLRAQQGDALHSAYLTQQMQAHQEALTLHRGYAEGGDTPELQKAATAAVPIIEQHLERLRRIGSNP